MTWLLDLYNTYEENLDQVGIVTKGRFDEEYMLLPEAHTYQTAHVEIRLNLKGIFMGASVLEKGSGNTVIPCSIESSTRSSKPEPHALHDNLQYVAGDY
ncbi:MAG: type I-C CRISPR-associated protein Cas8c/Csd1, partial [Acidaminococcaceae bacterium]